MKSVVIYYTFEGNTRYVAEKIAARLGADILELVIRDDTPPRKRRSIFRKRKRRASVDSTRLSSYQFNPAKYNTAILCIPVWSSGITSLIRTFLKENRLQGMKIGCVFCTSGVNLITDFTDIGSMFGISDPTAELTLIDPMSWPVQELDENIKDFCQKIQ